MSTDFLKALEKSQTLPELPDKAPGRVPDLLAGAGGVSDLTRTVTDNEPGKIPGVQDTNFDFQCARLIIGKVSRGYNQGQEEFEEQDDGDRLKAIMDKELKGECIVSKKETTFLKDGTVVVWVEWLEPRTQPPRSKRDYMTTSELLDPEESPKKPREENLEDDTSESETADALDDSAEGYPFRVSNDPVTDDSEE